MKKNRLVCFLAIVFLFIGSVFVSCKTEPDRGVGDGFTVTIVARGPGVVQMKDGSGKVLSSGYRAHKGERILFYAKADSDAHIRRWAGLDKPVSRRKSLSVEVEKDLNITVFFEKGTLEIYEIDFTAENADGLVRCFLIKGSDEEEEEVASPYDAVKGERLIFRAEPEKYRCVKNAQDWTGSADLRVKPSSKNLEAELVVHNAVSVRVRFSVETVNITYTAIEDNGSVVARIRNKTEIIQPGVVEVPKGTEIVFTSSPAKNYSTVFGGAKKVNPNEAILRAEEDSKVVVSFDSLVDVKIFNVQNGVEFPKGMDDSLSGSLTKSFRIDRFPVTYDLWYKVRQFAQNEGYRFGFFRGMGGYVGAGRFGRPPKDLGKSPTDLNRKHPVTTIDWTAALVWCNAYSEMTGLEPVYYTDSSFTEPIKQTDSGLIYEVNSCVVKEDANGYRMLTGDEWEFAARLTLDSSNAVSDGNGGFSYVNVNNNKYYFTKGNSACGALKSYEDKEAVKEVAHVYEEWSNPAKGETIAVGSKKASSLGLYDMVGNTQTWIFDNPSGSHFKPIPGTFEEPSFYRCLRGAAFGTPPADARDTFNKPFEESKVVCIGYHKAYFGVWQGGGFGIGLRVGRNLED